MTELKLTWNAGGANLSDSKGFVRFVVRRPMIGLRSDWVLYRLNGHAQTFIGGFPSAEAAKANAESMPL